MISQRTYHIFISIAVLLLAGCSAERKNVFSKTYHNTTARYNAYFYAKEQINEIEKIIEQSQKDNYGKILPLYPKIDSTLAVSYKDNVSETIKMAGIAIERHKNSKWVDDSWILVGRARFYDLDFENAIKTYKHINNISKDKNARHEALIRLIRTYTDYEEYANAKAVSDYLEKEKLNKKNKKHLYITRGYLYQELDDLDNMVRNLVEAAPLLKKSDDKARILFIIGQVYQDLGFEAEAYNYYKQSLSSNPEYELDFHARLNMAQVTQLTDGSDLKSARKVFEKLLEDSKNEEFKNKIYYEWGKFEAKQGNLDNALDIYKKSLREGNEPRLKGLAYYQLATIYYDSLSNYRQAQAYYDSMLNVIPRDEELNFALVEKRHEVLDDFVKHLNTIETNDSLLTLASKDISEIKAILLAQVEEERARKEIAKQNARESSNRISSNSFYMDDNSSSLSSTWYFNNPSAMAVGQNEFIKTWGNRPLTDYWRIASKIDQQQNSSGNNSDSGLTAEGGTSDQAGDPVDINNEVEQLFSQLPLTNEKREKALEEIEDAYYHLGNIYSLALNEKENARIEFENLLERFPETEYEAEALYQLFLIYKAIDDSRYLMYKKKLLEKYPYSKFAKLAENPNYTEETNAVAEKQKLIYRSAFSLYDSGAYVPALQLLNQTIKETEETYFTSHLALLKIMIIGKTNDISRYQYELTEFIKKYPDSDLNSFASDLLEASKEIEKRNTAEKGIQYIPFFDQQHYFVILYPASKNMESFSEAIEAFNGRYRYTDLKTSNLILNSDYSMILVTDFPNNEVAMEYFDDFFNSDELNTQMPNFNLVKFVISKDNFNIFYQHKALAEYLAFFEKFY